MKRRILSILLVLILGLSLVPTVHAASAYDRPGQKLVCLTFDDGPGPYVEEILEVLARHNARATFFISGNSYRLRPELVPEILRWGHQIGNHTDQHLRLAQQTDEVIRQEVTTMDAALREVLGLTEEDDRTFYLRPPHGSCDPRVASVADVPTIMWTVDSLDWHYQSVDHLLNVVEPSIQDGDIVLLHDPVQTTAQGLDALLTQLEARGFEMVTVEELFWRRGVVPENGEIYYSVRDTGVEYCGNDLYWDESRLDTHWAWESISYVREHGLMSGNEEGEFTPQFPLTRGMFVTILGRLSGVEIGESEDGDEAEDKTGAEEKDEPAGKEEPAEKDESADQDEAPETEEPADTEEPEEENESEDQEEVRENKSGFLDIPDTHYAAAYAAWSRETGVMVGHGDGLFGVNEPLTREQMAVALARYAILRGAKPGDFDLTFYADQEEISSWAREGVAQCSALGLLQGSEDGFRPHDTTTRAMGAVILHRLAEFDDKK